MKKVEQYGRLFFQVKSRTRNKLRHVVDLEEVGRFPCVCNCEAWEFNVTRPVCAHVVRCIHWVLMPFKFRKAKREMIKDGIVFGLQMGQPLILSLAQCLKHLDGFDYIEPEEPKPEPQPKPKPKNNRRFYALSMPTH